MQVKYIHTYINAGLECGYLQVSYVEGRSEFNGRMDGSLYAQLCDPVAGECLLGQIS